MGIKKVDNSNKPIKDVVWKKEYFYSSDNYMMMPFCPSCGEPAYQDEECVFCHQRYVMTPKPSGYEDTVITIGDWEIAQIYGSWSVYISHKDKIIIHASCSGKISKKELRRWLNTYIEEKKEE